MENQPFIGMGHNPDGIDLPEGLSMQLGMHPKAVETFGSMTNAEKQAAVRYIQCANSGDDAKHRINYTISQMEKGEKFF